MGDETQIFENYRVLGWEHVDVRAGLFKAMKNSTTATLARKNPLPLIPAGGASVRTMTPNVAAGLFPYQRFMDGIGSLSTSPHCQDYGRRSCHNVSACPDSWLTGLSGFDVSHNVALLV